VIAIAGGPITGWFMIVTDSLFVDDRLPQSDPRRDWPLAGFIANAIVTGLALLAWVPYFREPSRGSFVLALGVWFMTGWFYTFAIWA